MEAGAPRLPPGVAATMQPWVPAWVPLYLGSLICTLGLVVTRHAYKLSVSFRARLAATGFHELKVDATVAERAAVMLAVLRDAWPASVSEMLQDTQTGHGMVFTSLMVTGCLGALQTDFAALTPCWDVAAPVAFGMGLVHLLRRLLFAAAIGFCFAPAAGQDHQVASMRKPLREAVTGAAESEPSERLKGVPLLEKASIASLPATQRDEMGRTAFVGTVHVVLSQAMLSALPSLEFIALLFDCYMNWSAHESRLRAYDLCSLAWAALALLRALNVIVIFVCMAVFGWHFLFGFFTPGDHSYRGFWPEYFACRSFADLMLMAALQSWFSWPDFFDLLPGWFQTSSLVFAGAHGLTSLIFCLRSLRLTARDHQYSEDELATLFLEWRSQEAGFQTLLDMQLALVGTVRELGLTHSWAASRGLLLRQARIVCKFRRAVGDPPPAARKRSGTDTGRSRSSSSFSADEGKKPQGEKPHEGKKPPQAEKSKQGKKPQGKKPQGEGKKPHAE